MDDDDLTQILDDLATGRIDAAEAARLIDELKARVTSESLPDDTAAEPSHEEPSNEELRDEQAGGREPYAPYAREVFTPDDSASRRRSPGAKGVERISVRAVGRRVKIVGDPSVATASAEGPHVLRRDGSVLEVVSDGEFGPSFDGFSVLRPPRLDDLRSFSLTKELSLRVNPSIAVDVEVTAGSLACEGVPFLGKVRLTAGAAEVSGAEQLDDILIQAGSATLRGRLATGRSRVRCESGQLTIELDDDSNVTVRAEVQLGRITWAPNLGAGVDEVVLGNGSARLDVGVVMGWATIKTGLDLR